VPENRQEENLNVSAYGVDLRMSGTTTLIVVGLFIALACLIFMTFRYVESSREMIAAQRELDRQQFAIARETMVEQQKLNREQYWLIYRELRIQTGLMSLPEWKRPELVHPKELEESLREHLDQSPPLEPPLFEGKDKPVPVPDGENDVQ
jgi:hypothetical protein